MVNFHDMPWLGPSMVCLERTPNVASREREWMQHMWLGGQTKDAALDMTQHRAMHAYEHIQMIRFPAMRASC